MFPEGPDFSGPSGNCLFHSFLPSNPKIRYILGMYKNDILNLEPTILVDNEEHEQLTYD